MKLIMFNWIKILKNWKSIWLVEDLWNKSTIEHVYILEKDYVRMELKKSVVYVLPKEHELHSLHALNVKEIIK